MTEMANGRRGDTANRRRGESAVGRWGDTAMGRYRDAANGREALCPVGTNDGSQAIYCLEKAPRGNPSRRDGLMRDAALRSYPRQNIRTLIVNRSYRTLPPSSRIP
jgi:hypothetical protein